jgi:glyoxylase-like metal-dependent hydrolase (beta-lactamase superfamily II)
MNISVERFITGPIETNSFVVYDEAGHSIIIDPSSGCSKIIDFCKTKSLQPAAIVLTHGHFDHFMGLAELQQAFAITAVYAHRDEHALVRTPQLNGSHLMGIEVSYEGALSELVEGQMNIGGLALEVLLIAGHSPGGCALLFAPNHCVVGDILFAGSVGRTDLPGGNAVALISGIKQKLLFLSPDTIVYPGHGGRTTISREQRLNPFLN